MQAKSSEEENTPRDRAMPIVNENAEIDEMKIAHNEYGDEEPPTGDPVNIEVQDGTSSNGDPDRIIERETIIFPGEEGHGDDAFETADSDEEVLVIAETKMEDSVYENENGNETEPVTCPELTR